MKITRQIVCVAVCVLGLIAAVIVPFLMGCAGIAPGSDAFVVRAEQAESFTKGTFETAMNLDDSNRAFWETNAAPFHAFCTYLRTPIPYSGTNLQRGLVMLESLDNVKLAYKAGSATSNDVTAAIETLLAVTTNTLSLIPNK